MKLMDDRCLCGRLRKKVGRWIDEAWPSHRQGTGPRSCDRGYGNIGIEEKSK